MPRLRQSVRRFVLVGVCLLVVFAGQACHNNSRFAPATTLVLIDQSWVDMQQEHQLRCLAASTAL
jgi:hypothetical protein